MSRVWPLDSTRVVAEMPDSEEGKGKTRMTGERPSVAPSPDDPRDEKKSVTADAVEKASVPEVVVSDSEDQLMAGDYRPLKSALKKSKKKPRQSKNIPHNYFMTMRGWRPALVPFPHGFHPKPHAPRNTLWWNNIPKNADHIMAPPPVPKMPKDEPEEDDGKSKSSVKKADEEKKGEKEKPKKESGDPKEKAKSDAKGVEKKVHSEWLGLNED